MINIAHSIQILNKIIYLIYYFLIVSLITQLFVWFSNIIKFFSLFHVTQVNSHNLTLNTDLQRYFKFFSLYWQGRALFDTGDSDRHQHVLYQMRPISTRSDVESLSYDPKTKCQTVKNDSFFGRIFYFLGKSRTKN